jgi:hypothetical protein
MTMKLLTSTAAAMNNARRLGRGNASCRARATPTCRRKKCQKCRFRRTIMRFLRRLCSEVKSSENCEAALQKPCCTKPRSANHAMEIWPDCCRGGRSEVAAGNVERVPICG